MADTKISALPASTTPLTGTEVLPVVQSGTTKQVSVANLTAGRAVSALSTTVTGNSILNGALASDVGLLKNIGRGYGVASERWIGSDGTFTTWFYNVPTGGNHYFAINNVNKLTIVGDNVNIPDGNLVPATAAKGVNFTANTPAAGMTSQLLNWYEEGTYAPTISAAVGTITTSSATAYYTRIGRLVTVSARVQITTAGTGAGSLIMSVPFNIANRSVGSARETALTGYGGTAWASSGTDLYIQQYDNNSMIASGADITVTMNYMT